MKRFNTTGTCYAGKHYMVNIDGRVRQIKQMVDRGDYFCINRGRQYGKTTTLRFLKKALDADYAVFFISFEGMPRQSVESQESFDRAFLEKLRTIAHEGECVLDKKAMQFLDASVATCQADMLSEDITTLCNRNRTPLVLIIDDADKLKDCEPFIRFLGVLRNNYMFRETRATFRSVILCSVHDITNLELKPLADGLPRRNAPWNIAANFDVRMELSEDGIRGLGVREITVRTAGGEKTIVEAVV